MNLADIRKKAEESRKSAADNAVRVIDEPVELPEAEIPEAVATDEPVLAQAEMPGEDFPEEFFSSAGQVPKADTCESDSTAAIICPDEFLAESFSDPSIILDAEAAESTVSCPSQPAVIAPKRSTGYDPLETILSGRESAADADDDVLSPTSAYSSAAVEEYLCFRVADEVYAISIMAIKEIVKPRDVTEVPRMPVFISGVLSLRGVIIPVMDMRLRLSLSVNAVTGRERIVVLRRDSGFCGVLVDEVIQVARINKSDIEAPPAVLDGIDRDFVTGLGHFDNRILILLNLETILDIAVH